MKPKNFPNRVQKRREKRFLKLQEKYIKDRELDNMKYEEFEEMQNLAIKLNSNITK